MRFGPEATIPNGAHGVFVKAGARLRPRLQSPAEQPILTQGKVAGNPVKGPERITTERLVLRKPDSGDADAIFARYAGDPAIGKYIAWPIHESVTETHDFLEFSNSEWRKWPAGPYLIFSADERTLLGSTGLAFETEKRASTGYVLATDCWGQGIATEAVGAMQELAQQLVLARLSAICHTEHLASRRVLEKSGFQFEGTLYRFCVFPNHPETAYQDVFSFSWLPD